MGGGGGAAVMAAVMAAEEEEEEEGAVFLERRLALPRQPSQYSMYPSTAVRVRHSYTSTICPIERERGG